MRPFNIIDLELISTMSSSEGSSWLVEAEASIDFLKSNAQNDEIVIYASTKCVLIHGVLALRRKLTNEAIVKLQHCNIPMLDDSWRIQKVWGGRPTHRMYLEPPLVSTSDSFAGGEKLIFRRSFNGVDVDRPSIEISQKLIHSLDLYFVAERNAYCRLDQRGDIEDVVKIFQINRDSTSDCIDIVTIRRQDLDKFMALSKTSLLLCFDFTRVRWGNFCGWGDVERYERIYADLCYHGGVDAQGSYCNGVMAVHPQITVTDLVRQWKDEESPANKKHVTFKFFDRKNNINVESSCSPDLLSNYFQKSDLPWEVSPVFFRSEVLHRFKADPEKYSLEDRSINCRNSWHLKTYDINEVGQVHTYIGYLGNLPYEEQLYWQAFNEWPKGPISKRAHQTDIVGDWCFDYEPLSNLKYTISGLDAKSPDWWKKRGESLANAVLYPATDSTKEWANEILALDQFLVEGFLLKPLRILAESGGSIVQSSWGSLRVLQEVLVSRGLTEDDAKGLVMPMQKLHALRNEVRGHATVEKKRAAETKARGDFGTLREHFKNLVTNCERTFNSILEILGIELKR